MECLPLVAPRAGMVILNVKVPEASGFVQKARDKLKIVSASTFREFRFTKQWIKGNMKNLLSLLIVVFTINAFACDPIDQRSPNEIAQDLCENAGQEWKCLTFSTGQEKCQCVEPGGPESFDLKDQT